MDLLSFISDMDRRSKLATACGTTGDWLYQIATKWDGRRASTDLAKKIETESRKIGPKAVPKESLRPDVWGDSTQEIDSAA